MRKMYKILGAVVGCWLLLSAFQPVKMVKTKISDGINMLLPEGFVPLTEADINVKYVSTKPPVAAYTNYDRNVDLGINIAYSRWNNEDIEIMKGFYKSNIMGLYDQVQFLKEDVEEINGRKFAVFEFLSTVEDEEGTTFNQQAISKYHRIQYAIVKSKTVLFNFNCPAMLKDKWAPIAREMMSSIKISKTL